jgi:hypothetical protein
MNDEALIAIGIDDVEVPPDRAGIRCARSVPCPIAEYLLPG